MPSTSHYRFRFERSDEQINQAYSDPRYFERMAQAIGGLNVQVLEVRLRLQAECDACDQLMTGA